MPDIRFEKEVIPSNRGVGLDLYYITDSKQRIGLKPGIIAKTHSERNADLIVTALNHYDLMHEHETEVEDGTDD